MVNISVEISTPARTDRQRGKEVEKAWLLDRSTSLSIDVASVSEAVSYSSLIEGTSAPSDSRAEEVEMI